MTKFTAMLLGPLVVALTTGCADILNPPPRRDAAYAPVRADDTSAPTTNVGAIYQSGFEMRLFEDIRARRVGDTLTIRLTERTDATKDGETQTNRSATTTVQAPILMGQEAAQLLGYDVKTSLESSHKFNGTGQVTQSNALTGNVSVTVVEVLPNGNLRIRGEKRLGLNQGNEYVKLSGIIRPADIDVNNTVDSTKIADATMIYNGDGVVADANRMGWLQRFFNSVLFPF